MKTQQIDGKMQINLEAANILLLERSAQGLDILAQVIAGFGGRQFHRCARIKEAEDVLRNSPVDLIILDPAVEDDAGFEFVRWLRASRLKPNCYAPVVIVTGYTQASNIKRLRDIGANFAIAKPIVPKVLLERILWIARVARPFVECEVYNGPDRRFKYEGPPVGMEGRRADDLPAEIGQARDPNLSQVQIDHVVKPQKASL